MHIHVNDFQVTQVVNPITGIATGVQPFGIDNANVPAALTDADENPIAPAKLTLRTEFVEFDGTYVIHCHRLNHEDNGLMAAINVIPEVSTYAVAIPGSTGKPATVQVHDGNGDRVIETVTPFPAFEGTPTVAMADVNGDMVLDLVVGTGPGVAPEVLAYNVNDTPNGPFKEEIIRFAPFDANFRGGVNVAAADIDGNALADNIIVGSGPGMESQVEVFSSTLPTEKGKAPDVFSSFTPYPGSQSGVTVATGLVSYEQGRQSIVTAPGPGDPTMVSEFLAYDQSYTGGVSLSTGWIAGQEGGAQSIVTGQLAGDGTVRVWSSGSRLDGAPEFYTHSMGQHSGHVEFRQTASFNPFSSGVTVATTSTTAGADLLVSGVGPQGAEVIKFGLGRADPQANTLTPRVLTRLPAIPRLNGPAPLAGR